MKRIYFRLAGMLCAALFTLAGCMSVAPNLERQFGESVSLIKAQQTLNPEAARNTDPVKGMDGRTAKSAYDEYQKSYKAPPPQQNVFAIGFGGNK